MTASVFIAAVVAIFVALSVIMTIAWAIQRRTRNSGWIDATWTFGLGAVGVVAALTPLSGTGGLSTRQGLVALLIAAWAARLGLHIVARNGRITDDPRYAEIERGYGDDASRGMFWLCQKQAWVTVPLATSVLLAAQNPAPGLRLQDMLAILVLVVAIAGEGLADRQLRAFASQPANKGKVCDVGLWGWSRHPNYFFEWLGWCAYPLFAIEWSGQYPWGWLALLGPLCMYLLLAHVSGVPPLERHMVRSRGDAYRAYQERVSAFFPMPPRAR